MSGATETGLPTSTFYKDMPGSTHVLALPEIAVQAIPEDERVWVPQAPNVWFRLLMRDRMAGQWCDLPREIHDSWVPDDAEEMITFFDITGSTVYLDETHRHLGYEDVFTEIDRCRAHHASCGLGADDVDQFIR